MDRSVDRYKTMQEHLQQMKYIRNFRVKGLSLDNIYFPNDVLSNWDTLYSVINTTEFIPVRSSIDIKAEPKYSNRTHVMVGLCGRKNTNDIKEIGCTSSHLEAIRQAIYSKTATSRYAIIVEDDVSFPFNIDFHELAKSAPNDFGILQLFNSNEDSMVHLFKKYIKNGQLWHERLPKQYLAFWSTCAYLIDRVVLKPIIDKIIYMDCETAWIHFNIIAGIFSPCRPKFTTCCLNTTIDNRIFQPPCIWAPKGFQADSFIYSMTRTYVIGIPLITNSVGGNQSTFHQSHVESLHQKAFTQQRKLINQFITGLVPLPSFVNISCQDPLSVDVIVHKRPPCVYSNRTNDQQSVTVYWINKKEEVKARKEMENYLSNKIGLRNQRIEAIDESQIFIPSDIVKTWDSKWCMFESKATNESLVKISESLQDIAIVVTGLCGRGKGRNSLLDLPTTLSHLNAIHRAIFHNISTNRFALISEDDVRIPFDIDYDNLAKSAFTQLVDSSKTRNKTSPTLHYRSSFAILRLYSSHESHVERNKNTYLHNYRANFNIDSNPSHFASALWSIHNSDARHGYDSDGVKLYLIDRFKLKPIIQSIFYPRSPAPIHSSTLTSESIAVENPHQTIFETKIIAGLFIPCIPSECCQTFNVTSLNIMNISSVDLPNFVRSNACLFIRSGFTADRFIFSMTKSLVINLPVAYSIQSQYHPTLSYNSSDHLNVSAANHSTMGTTNRFKSILNSMINEKIDLPKFIRVGCNHPLE